VRVAGAKKWLARVLGLLANSGKRKEKKRKLLKNQKIF